MCSQNNGLKPPEDQYEKLAKHYDRVIGSIDQRTDMYKQFFAGILRKFNCNYVLDASCGTGVDSMILLEHGFKVVSVDISVKMLECARKYRAQKMGDPRYKEWIIEQANWETLPDDVSRFLPQDTQFDGVICLANSISHVLDDDGAQTLQRRCLRNLARCVKPGGVLIVDHRNYDAMLNDLPPAAQGNVYYKYRNSVDIQSKLIMKDGKTEKVALQFFIEDENGPSEFKLVMYPHRLASFSQLLEEAFEHRATHHVYGDFEPIADTAPGFYQHVVIKH